MHLRPPRVSMNLQASNRFQILSHHRIPLPTDLRLIPVVAMLPSHCENMLAYGAELQVDPRAYQLNCPRCGSANTKFCYYNNYNVSQPRYRCKGCRRFWTEGGSQRDVPVGGGRRKNRRRKPARTMADDTVDAPVVRPDLLLHGMVGSLDAEQGHQPASSMPRPDLLLDGMAAEPGHQTADKSAGTEQGSMIDLALLCSKFLNHEPLAAEQCAVVPVSVDTPSPIGSSIPPALSGPSQHGLEFDRDLCVSASGGSAAAMLQYCADARAQALGAFNLRVDQSCYHSLGLATNGGDLILPAAWHPESTYEPFDPLPEDAMTMIHHGAGPDGHDVWTKVLGCQEQRLKVALYRP